MEDGILIVGGYGAVGKVVASQLARQYGHQLIIAGRSDARAAELASSLGSSVRWRQLDLADPIDYDTALAQVRLVVMCLDVPDVEFVRRCFQRGIDYVDISAEYPILASISMLDMTARQHGSTAVLSVGLVPGLSNLMARHSLQFVENISRFDSALLGGLGEKHGVGASAWVLSHLGDASETARFQFREPYHEKSVHRFAFADQYTLPQTLPIEAAATWLGFDSFLMTRLIGLARLPALRSLFQRHSIQAFLLNATQRWQIGRDDFVLTTRACGDKGVYQAWLHGKGEARATGLVTTEVIRRLLAQPQATGVFHIEQMFELGEFLAALQQHNITFADARFER